MEFKLLIICVGIIAMSWGVVCEHNENSNIDNILNNLETTTFHVPRHIQKREHSAIPKLVRSVVPNVVTVPRVTLQPNIKLNLKLDRPILSPATKKTDAKRVIGNAPSEVRVAKVANRDQPQSVPVNNQNGHIHVVIPKEYKEHVRKPVKFYEEPVVVPVKATDVTQPENDAATKPTPVKLDSPKADSPIKNKTEIEPKTVNMDSKKSIINIFKTENVVEAETPKNITDCNDIENRIGNEDTHIIDEIPKTIIAPCEKENTDGKAPLIESKLTKVLTMNKESDGGTGQAKEFGCNDIKNHITIHNRNYEETVQKVGDTPRLTMMSENYQEQYPDGTNTVLNPYQEWTYENPYSNVNKYTTMGVTPIYQTVYPSPQYKTANNYGSNFDDSNDLLSVYPGDNNKYIIRRSWKNTDITIHSNNEPVEMIKANEVPFGVSGYDAGTWFGNLPAINGVYSSKSCYSNQNTGRRYRYFY